MGAYSKRAKILSTIGTIARHVGRNYDYQTRFWKVEAENFAPYLGTRAEGASGATGYRFRQGLSMSACGNRTGQERIAAAG